MRVPQGRESLLGGNDPAGNRPSALGADAERRRGHRQRPRGRRRRRRRRRSTREGRLDQPLPPRPPPAPPRPRPIRATSHKQATAAADAADVRVAADERGQASRSRWTASTAASPPSRPTRRCPPTSHQTANQRGQERQHRSGSRTRAASPTGRQPDRRNGNYAGATFMHFENLGYDFLLGDGTGGLSIWSLKNPENPLFVGGVTADAARCSRPATSATATSRPTRHGPLLRG